MERALQHCQDLVRRSDWEGYLCSLFTLPAHARPSIWALRAFNVETAMIRDQVKDPMMGKLRIQFWRDLISQVYQGRVPEHPVGVALSHALERQQLSQSWFKRILTAREASLFQTQYTALQDLETYAENTSASLLYLQLEAVGVRDTRLDHIASHIGKSIGIATALRGIPMHARMHRVLLGIPSQVAAKHGISAEQVFRETPDVIKSGKLQDAVLEVATLSNDHLATAISHLKDIRAGVYESVDACSATDQGTELPSSSNSSPTSPFSSDSSPHKQPTTSASLLQQLASAECVFLHGVPCSLFLKQLEQAEFDVYDEAKLSRKSLKLPLEIWWKRRLL